MGSDVYILYADELIFINFCVDFICLFVSLRLCDIKPRTARLIIASLCGGAYAVLAVFIENGVIRAAASIFAMCILCLIAAGITSLKRLSKLCGIFFLTCAVVGGIISGMLSLLGESESGISPVGLICAVLIASVAAAGYMLHARQKLEYRSVDVTIDTGVGTAEATLLVDSGNLAKEPSSGLPIIIISPLALPQCFRQSAESWPVETASIPIDTAIGRDVLQGFFPKEIKTANKPLKACIALGRNTDYGGCDGIIPKSIL